MLYLILGLLTLFLSSCGKVSFPKEQLTDSVKKICKDEYNLDVRVKYQGHILATYIEIDSLFDKSSLNSEAAERVGDIIMSVSRVSVSTDAEVEFYVVIAADKMVPGREVIFVRYVEDLRKFWWGGISRDDFGQRMMIDVRYNPAYLAKRTMLKFFSSLSKGDSNNLARYLKAAKDDTDLSLSLLRMILESKLKTNVNYDMKVIKVKAISKNRCLVYCEVIENYDPKPGYHAQDFTFEAGFKNKYLFVIGLQNYLPNVEEMIPLIYRDANKELQIRSFPKKYSSYEDVSAWDDDDFLVEEMSFPEFLAKQMAQRLIIRLHDIEEKVEHTKEAKEVNFNFLDMFKPKEETLIDLPVKVESIDGQYIIDEEQSSFILDFITHEKTGDLKLEPQWPGDLSDISLDVVKNVLTSYQFENYSHIQLRDKTKGQSLTVFKGKF